MKRHFRPAVYLLFTGCAFNFICTAFADNELQHLESSLLGSSVGPGSSKVDAMIWKKVISNTVSGTRCGNDQQCDQFVQDVIRYVEMGREHLDLPTEESATIVVGVTGVGKSTLTQFFANETNPLMAECDEETGNCRITDENGAIGDDLLSRTFVPNYVPDNKTNGILTAFYDMPGFDDNRNESVEIANAFFVKMIVERVQRVRVVIVTTHAHLASKSEIGNFMKNVVMLLKNPAKFKGGIGLLVNMAEPRRSDTQLLNTYRYNLGNFSEVISQIIEEPYRVAVTELTEELLVPDEDSSLKNVAWMRIPEESGHLNEIDEFVKDRVRIKSIVYNKTRPISKIDEDFGYSLSAEARLVLRSATEVFSGVIKQRMGILAPEITTDLFSAIHNVYQGTGNEEKLSELLKNLASASYDFLNSTDTTKTPSYFANELLRIVSTFDPSEKVEAVRNEINSTITFLDFVHMVEPGASFKQTDWAPELRLIEDNLKTFIRINMSSTIQTFLTQTVNQIETLALDELVTKLNDLANGNDGNFGAFNQSLYSLKQATYDGCKENIEIVSCLTYIERHVAAFAPSSTFEERENLKRVVKFLVLLKTSMNIDLLLAVDLHDMYLIHDNLKMISVSTLIPKSRDRANQTLLELSGNSTQGLFREFLKMASEQDPDQKLKDAIVSLTNQMYRCDDNFKQLECSEDIGSQASDYNIKPIPLDILQRLNYSAWFLQFCEFDVEIPRTYRLSDWTTDLKNIKADLESLLRANGTGNRIYANARNNLISQSTKLGQFMLSTTLPSISDIEEEDEKIQQLIGKNESIARISNDGPTVLIVISKILVEYNSFFGNDENYVVNMDPIEMTEMIYRLDWMPQDLSSPYQEEVVKNLLEPQAKYNTFLNIFGNDLVGYSVQVDNTGNFPAFWNNGAGNLNNLFQQLQGTGLPSADLLQSAQYQQLLTFDHHKTRLGQLLTFAVPRITCPTKTGTSLVFKYNFATMKFVKQCLAANTGITSVAIIVAHTFFINQDFSGADYSENSLHLYIMAANFVMPARMQISLNGKDGVDATTAGGSGGPGTPAGNIDTVYVSMDSRRLSMEANGGRGGNGATGSRGTSGTNGRAKSFNSDSSDCGAWRGEISIRVYPNNCNTGNNRCSPRWVEIKGTEGTNGGTGGRGGNSVRGSPGGVIRLIDLTSTEEAIPTTEGRSGAVGIGGEGGAGGVDGDTIKVSVVDKFSWTGYNCEESGRHTVPGATHAAGARGPPGIVVTKSIPKTIIDSLDFQIHVSGFRDLLNLRKTNPLFGGFITDVLSKLNSHPSTKLY